MGGDRPTAIIASNTVIALWMMRAVTALGLAWPRDVSLLAFEAPDWAEILQPPLAAIEHPTARMAALAWELLLRAHGRRRRARPHGWSLARRCICAARSARRRLDGAY